MSTPRGIWNRGEQTVLRLKAAAAMAAALLALAGCAADPTLDAVDWKHGARRGHVVNTYAADLPLAQPKCLADLPRDEYAAHRFVRARYHHGRLISSAVAPVPPGLNVKDGDVVELWPADCAAGNMARISRVLSTTPQ